jgi:hypothetical protein
MMIGTNVEKCVVIAATCVASTSLPPMEVKSVDPAGAVTTTTSDGDAPAGIFVGSKGRVTVTGTENCWPSGPNVYGVPRTVPLDGGGAEGSWVFVMVTFPETAPDGRDTEAPPFVTVPPFDPTVCETVTFWPDFGAHAASTTMTRQQIREPDDSNMHTSYLPRTTRQTESAETGATIVTYVGADVE